MPEPASKNVRQATAERNLEAILDGAERLLQRGRQASISAVAGEAGVSRVTVYSHFPDRGRLLEALVERAVGRAIAAIESAEPERGPAGDALGRVLGASWEELDRNAQIAGASAAELSADGMRRAHASIRDLLLRLVERGRREGAFRTDVPAAWLVTSCLALIHAAAEEVRAGELDPSAAFASLSVTVRDLFAGRDARAHAAAPSSR